MCNSLLCINLTAASTVIQSEAELTNPIQRPGHVTSGKSNRRLARCGSCDRSCRANHVTATCRRPNVVTFSLLVSFVVDTYGTHTLWYTHEHCSFFCGFVLGFLNARCHACMLHFKRHYGNIAPRTKNTTSTSRYVKPAFFSLRSFSFLLLTLRVQRRGE